MSPPLGVIADYTSYRRRLVGGLSLLSSVAAILTLLAFSSTWWLAGILAIFVSFGYEVYTETQTHVGCF